MMPAVLVLSMVCSAGPTTQPAGGLTAKLAAMPANSWLNTGQSWRGGHEVPATFDQANGLFFKYGGCGDYSPRINVEGSKRPDETYGNSCWGLDVKTGGWKMIRPRDVSFPANRPANGCSRGYVYDPNRKVIWLYGGISNGGGGGDPWDFWTYDARTDTFAQRRSKNRPRGGDSNGGDVFTYDPIHDLIIMPKGPTTWVYKPAENAWEERKTPDGPASPGHYGSLTFDVAAQRVVYPLSIATGKTAKERPTATPDGFWRYSSRDKQFHEFVFSTWTYDPATNTWERLALAEGAPRPSPRWRVGLTYDSKNQVVVLVGGSTDTWDESEVYFNDVWILETKKGAWRRMDPPRPWPAGGGAWRDCRQCAYDEADNVVLWLPVGGTVWAYRFK